jgi:hypothetical protein
MSDQIYTTQLHHAMIGKLACLYGRGSVPIFQLKIILYIGTTKRVSTCINFTTKVSCLQFEFTQLRAISILSDITVQILNW